MFIRVLGKDIKGKSCYYYLDPAKIEYAEVSTEERRQGQKEPLFALRLSLQGQFINLRRYAALEDIELLLVNLLPEGVNGCVTSTARGISQASTKKPAKRHQAARGMIISV